MGATPTIPDQGTSVPSSIAADPSAQSSWQTAAQPIPLDNKAGPVANAPKADAEMQPSTPASTGTVAAQPNPDMLPPETRELKPLQPGGLAGFMNKLGDLFAGRTRPELAKDEDGNTYVKKVALTGAEKWVRVLGTALTGAAEGFAAGRGRNFGAAAAAGVKAGAQIKDQQHQNEQEMTAEARQQTLMNANHQKLQMDIADHTWTMAQNKVKATQEMVKFARDGDKDLHDQYGYNFIGQSTHPGDLKEILKGDPNVVDNWITNKVIAIRPMYADDGTVTGWGAWKTDQDPRQVALAEGYPFNYWNPAKNEMEVHNSSHSGTLLQQQTYNDSASKGQLAYLKQKAETDKANAETDKTKAEKGKIDVETNTVLPSEVKKNNAEAFRANAEASKASTENMLLKQNQVVGGDGAQHLTHDQIVDGMLHGKVDITKAVGIFKDPHAREQYIADALAKDPTWTMQKYNAMMKMRQDMTSGKIGDKITSFNTFLGHASVVDDGVNTLRNGNSPLINHTVNWLRTNATNNPVVAGMLPEIDATRNEFQNFITNHALQKSEIERGEKLLNEDQTPAQMQASLKSFMQVALTKLGAVKSQVNETMGSDTPEMITPRNAQAIRNLGLEQYANNYGLMVNHPAAPAAPPSGAVGTAMSKLDNKIHYVSSTGQDLGVAPQ